MPRARPQAARQPVAPTALPQRRPAPTTSLPQRRPVPTTVPQRRPLPTTPAAPSQPGSHQKLPKGHEIQTDIVSIAIL